jgi:hypothetical protein
MVEWLISMISQLVYVFRQLVNLLVYLVNAVNGCLQMDFLLLSIVV